MPLGCTLLGHRVRFWAEGSMMRWGVRARVRVRRIEGRMRALPRRVATRPRFNREDARRPRAPRATVVVAAATDEAASMKVGLQTFFAEGFGPQEIVRQRWGPRWPGSTSSRSATTSTPGSTTTGHSRSPGRCWRDRRRRTERLGLATGVTCPRSATTRRSSPRRPRPGVLLWDGLFTLEMGLGEQLNEHVVGRGWPSVTERHESFARRSRSSACSGRAATSRTR